MKIHEKKIAPQWFELRLQGLKDWEIRVNDCDYQAGDYMILSEYDEYYTGRDMVVMITHVTKNAPYLPDNVVVLSTRDTVPVERARILKEISNDSKRVV